MWVDLWNSLLRTIAAQDPIFNEEEKLQAFEAFRIVRDLEKYKIPTEAPKVDFILSLPQFFIQKYCNFK